MSFNSFLTSSIGRKFVMAFTGLFLISFLIIHASINGMIFFNDGGKLFNEWAHFFSHNYIIRILEIGLFLGFIVHIYQGFLLWSKNSKSRKQGYAVGAGNATSKWYSRSMGILGSLILIFLVIHLSHFWVGTKTAMYVTNDESHNLYNEMKSAFSHLWIVIVYVLGVVSLGWHLIHGFSSAFQSLGINSPKYNPIIRKAGYVYSIVICLLFAMMPIAMYFEWIA